MESGWSELCTVITCKQSELYCDIPLQYLKKIGSIVIGKSAHT